MFEYYGVLSEDNHKEFNMACEELKVIFNDSSNGKYPADNSVIELITSLQSNVNSPCLSPEDRNNNIKNNTETNLDDLNSLQKVIRIILKGEWDKVKVESGDSYKKQRKLLFSIRLIKNTLFSVFYHQLKNKGIPLLEGVSPRKRYSNRRQRVFPGNKIGKHACHRKLQREYL